MRKTMNYRTLGWILGGMAAVFLILYLITGRQLSERSQQSSALQVTLTRLEEGNKAMETELEQVGTEEYVVSSAMTNFAFMNRNDLRFRFTNPEALYAYTEEELGILMEETSD